MNSEKINEVVEVLKNPKKDLLKLRNLSKELNNNEMTMSCSSCVTDAVVLLSSWLKKQGIVNNYFNKAMNGDYELKKINLFVQVYQSNHPERQKELDTCLKINKESGHFSNVIEINERLTFKQMFNLCAKYKDDINIIANSDIYFDETILWTRFMDDRQVYALSRWDYRGDRMAVLFNRKDSQDAWVFNGIPDQRLQADYNLGVAGCDNRIAWELKNVGYNVLNPSKTIHAIHLHQSEYRTYHAKDRLLEPYHFIHPHF